MSHEGTLARETMETVRMLRRRGRPGKDPRSCSGQGIRQPKVKREAGEPGPSWSWLLGAMEGGDLHLVKSVPSSAGAQQRIISAIRGFGLLAFTLACFR